MQHYGLIGYPLEHSFSQKYFTQKFENEGITGCVYELFPLNDISEFPGFVKSKPDLAGLNVTIPYKQAIIPFLHEMDETAASVGAVNTIRIDKDKLMGFNTDVFGFEQSLLEFLKIFWKKKGELKALVLGTGGASKAVTYVLKKLDIPYRLVSRNPGNDYLGYPELNKAILLSHFLIINTTPLGMSPNVETHPPLPYQFVGEEHLFYDLVYNPEKTLFLAAGAARGAEICNGLRMLHLQAEKAWEIWNAEK